MLRILWHFRIGVSRDFTEALGGRLVYEPWRWFGKGHTLPPQRALWAHGQGPERGPGLNWDGVWAWAGTKSRPGLGRGLGRDRIQAGAGTVWAGAAWGIGPIGCYVS